MARSMIDEATDLLWPATGRQTRDIKFSIEGRNRRDITAEGLAGMIVTSLRSVAEGHVRPVADLTGY